MSTKPRYTLDHFAVHFEYPVFWGDMDAANHVNNLVYLRWTESARVSLFEHSGIAVSLAEGGIGPILGWHDCKYIFPMRYPDTAIVGIEVQELNDHQCVLFCGIFSTQHKRIVATSKQIIIPYDYTTFKRAQVPDSWHQALREIGR